MKDRVKNLIIIGLILSLSISFYYNYIKNKDEADVNNAKTTKQENNQIPNNDIENVDENIEINPEPEEINLSAKTGSIRQIKYQRPIMKIIYDNLTMQEKLELIEFIEVITQADKLIHDLMYKYKTLSKTNYQVYRINAINELNDIFVVQDLIVDDIEILDYVECYDILAEVYAKNVAIQSMIDAHLENDANKLSELEEALYILQIKHNDSMAELMDNLKKTLD
jgi:hypothetical protein